MVNVFTVVGECREDPWRLLVMDAEGDYYDYLPAQERFTRLMANHVWTDYRRPDEGEGVDDAATEPELDPMPLAIDG